MWMSLALVGVARRASGRKISASITLECTFLLLVFTAFPSPLAHDCEGHDRMVLNRMYGDRESRRTGSSRLPRRMIVKPAYV